MTSDEIIKALRLCAHDDCDCMICPFCNVAFDCGEQMKLAAADLIESLQSQLAESQRREQEAIEDLHHCENSCDYCANAYRCNGRVCSEVDPRTGECADKWQWRDPQKGEEK